MLDTLQKFRFQKKTSQDVGDELKDASGSSTTQTPRSTPDIVIMETPESQLEGNRADSDSESDPCKKEECSSRTPAGNEDCTTSATEMDESPVVHNGFKRHRIVSTDTESEGESVDPVEDGKRWPSKRSKVADTELECLTTRERCLRELMEVYTKADVMEIQDALVRSDWDIDKAFVYLRTNLPSTPTNGHCRSRGATRTSSAKGVVFEGADGKEAEGHRTGSKHVARAPRPRTESKFKTFNRLQVNAQQTLKPAGPPQAKKKMALADNSDDDCDYQNENIYDSGDDSDERENEDDVTPAKANARKVVAEFFNEATIAELMAIPSCSKKKAEAVVENRPYGSWSALVEKFETRKNLAPALLNGAKDLLHTRGVVQRLMHRCQKISEQIERTVTGLVQGRSDDAEGHVEEQPSILNGSCKLAPYQLIGLNWLALMHKQQVNGILADEMGLGKTIQAVAFLAYLYQQGERGPHVVVVPSSTLENWMREFETWCPTLSVLVYHGSLEDRRELRYQILDGEVGEFNVLITTYHMVASNSEDRSLFKKFPFNYVIFDEAHMLKNMASQRYANLMKINARRKILLTGTPLQNNLVELMSLLTFVMPSMFSKNMNQIKFMFSSAAKDEADQSKFEQERIAQAKQIMRPFVLRRLKRDVLQQLPDKREEVRRCPMTPHQETQYRKLVERLSKEFKEREKSDSTGMLMKLRRASNHPLLLRHYYDEEKLTAMAHLMLEEPTHRDADPHLIFEDMEVMSDFELHTLCEKYESVKRYKLDDDKILDSGKFQKLDSILKEHVEKGNRVLIFSQFTMMLDILEEYLNIRGHKWLRLDGQTSVPDRQDLIDQFNKDDSILVFLLSTRAGGLGINLTSANVVVLHDLDFNPYNDKQAEDRCHRLGQDKEVLVLKLISKDTIEEGILSVAREKLKLEKDVTEEHVKEDEAASVAHLLKSALGC